MTRAIRPVAYFLPLAALVGAACVVWAAPTDRRIDYRINALRQQAELRYGEESKKAAEIDAAIDRLIAAWDQIDRPSDGDHRRVHRWLDKAFRTTLPGRSGSMPRTPRFVGSPALEQPEGVVRPEPEPAAASFKPRTPKSRSPQFTDQGPVLQGVDQLGGVQPTNPTELTRVEAAKPVVTAPERRTPNEPATTRQPQRSRWSRHPAAAPLDWQDPFVDDPSASANPLRPGVTHRVRRPAFSDELAVAVDLAELGARVRGFNNAVRSLQQRLLADPAPDAFSLSDWADELERLDEERSFLNLYRDGLPPEASRLLPPSPSIEVVSELLRRRASDQLQSLDDRGAVEQRALETITARMSRLGADRAEL